MNIKHIPHGKMILGIVEIAIPSIQNEKYQIWYKDVIGDLNKIEFDCMDDLISFFNFYKLCKSMAQTQESKWRMFEKTNLERFILIFREFIDKIKNELL